MPKGVAYTEKRKEQSVYLQSALSGKHERDAYEWDAIGGSERLRDAIHSAVSRFANDNRMSAPEAAALLIGRDTRISSPTRINAPTDYTGYRPGEVRPIGQIIEPIVARVLAEGIE